MIDQRLGIIMRRNGLSGAEVFCCLSRKLSTKDKDILGYKEDRSFYEQKLMIIYAWGSHSFVYHGANRGSMEISFFTDDNSFVPPEGSDKFLLKSPIL